MGKYLTFCCKGFTFLCDGCQQIRYFVVCTLSVIETYKLPSSNLHSPSLPSPSLWRIKLIFFQDGDGVTFGFVGGTTTSGLFRIEPNTGVIRLINGQINLDRDKYELNVTAMDDGKCCVESGAPVDPTNVHTSTAVVVVFITDVNDNKPIFQDCASYAPKIEEGAPNGSPVIKVHALDKDKGVNGQVKYSIVQQPNQKGTKFTVDEETGELFTNKVFDREGDDGKTVSVTVKAIDSGEPSLEGVCSFTVEITDVNDNPPLFDRQKYIENVKQDTNIGTNILRVSASDEDADNNGAIRYSLAAPFQRDDLNYFDIQQESGWIFLKRPLDVSRPPCSFLPFVCISISCDLG